MPDSPDRPVAACPAPSAALAARPAPSASACIAVAVSGGADSLYALARLSALYTPQGGRVLALHGLFLPPQQSASPGSSPASSADSSAAPSADTPAIAGLRGACALLGAELHIVDLRAAFDQQVIAPFLAAYLQGHTPNPCAHCNAQIKFGALWQAARALGASHLATGHYAALAAHPLYGCALRQAQDLVKDQSYFLSLVPMARLATALFPLAGQHKAEALEFLRSQGLSVPIPQESQDICFVPSSLEDGYRTFIEQQARARHLPLGPAGPMCLPDGRIVGQHHGLWNYTQGQRRGLGVAYSEPLYVIGKDIPHNSLRLGTRADATMQACRTLPANFLVDPALWPATLSVRVRYRQPNIPARISVHEGCLQLLFPQSLQAAAPGQIATVYDSDGFVLAGALIA